MEASNGLDGEMTRPTSAMHVSSSDEDFMPPGGNDGIGVLERPSPLSHVATVSASAVTSSSDEGSDVGREKDSATPVPTPMNHPLPNQLTPFLPIFPTSLISLNSSQHY